MSAIEVTHRVFGSSLRRCKGICTAITCFVLGGRGLLSGYSVGTWDICRLPVFAVECFLLVASRHVLSICRASPLSTEILLQAVIREKLWALFLFLARWAGVPALFVCESDYLVTSLSLDWRFLYRRTDQGGCFGVGRPADSSRSI